MISSIPPIPTGVPLAHKNYDLGEALLKEKNTPYTGFSNKQFESLFDLYKAYSVSHKLMHEEYNSTDYSTINPWNRIEDFFQFLADEKENEENGNCKEQEKGEGEGTPEIPEDVKDLMEDMDLNEESEVKEKEQDSTERILDLEKEVQKRETTPLTETAREAVENLDQFESKDIEGFKIQVDKALTAALSKGKQKLERDTEDYKKFDVLQEDILPLAMEKHLLIPELEDIMMLEWIEGRLSSIQPVKQKQEKLYIMIDDSGSMDCPQKKGIVQLALVLAQKKGVTVEVFLFEEDLYNDSFTLSKNNFPPLHLDGGGTDVEKSVMSLSKIVKKGDSILIINDGEDEIENFTPPVKTFALTLGVHNEGLENLCKRTGGKYFQIPWKKYK